MVGLVDTNGSVVVEYKYDAWGRIVGSAGSLAATLGKLNPFRYRGYVYDEETQMYYCRSRYYCPKIQWWISIDEDLAGGHKLLGRNLVVYSANNPTNCTDITGERTYFINGINNNTRKEGDGLLPQSAINSIKAYEALYNDDVVCIPVFVGGNTWSGISEVWQETIGNDAYTKYIVDMIRTD